MSRRIGSVLWREPVALSDGSATFAYGIAALAVFAALGVRLSLFPVLGDHSPYLPFTLAVMVAARFGGRGPGFAATVLSALAVTWYFLEPIHTLVISSRPAAAGLALFVVVASLISQLAGHLRESLISSIRKQRELRRQSQMIDLSHDAVIMADSSRHITLWNAGATEMYGWTERDALGKVIHELLQTTNHVSTGEIDQVLRREKRWDGELCQTARDGRRLVVESRQVLVLDDANQAVGILEINRDITERKRAEDAVRQASEQRRLALEAASMGAWEYQLDTGSVFMDERCARTFGEAAAGPLDSGGILARIHPDDRAASAESVKQAIAGASGGLYERQYRVVWPDGSVHWVASHGRVSFEGEGDRRRAVRFVGVSMEITERRHAEERLRQSQKLESIGLLAGGVAHDFNNLLTVIMGSATCALEECPSCEHSRAIVSAAERAAYLTKQLLAYAGKGQMAVKMVDLTEIVTQSTSLLSASLPKRIDLCFHVSRDLPCLEADPSRIEQILMNLVINAGEAIPARCGGRIEIATSSCEVTPEMARRHSREYDVAAGVYVCLEVRDNGAGIDAATMPRIFDPFFSTKFTGRGLGLAAIHGIVRSSNGFIDVHSSPGAGTAFRVYLPASGKARPEAPFRAAPPRQARGSATILVVDDEDMVRRLACMTLRRHGYDVLEAKDGRDALQALAAAPSLPSLVLLDLAMPIMGGDELVPILGEKYPGLKVVVSSGYPEDDARKNFASGSVTSFLQKPYTVVTLAEKIGEALGGTPAPLAPKLCHVIELRGNEA